LITFDIPLGGEVAADKVRAELARQGYTRVEQVDDSTLRVTQDRVRLEEKRRDRITEAVEGALRARQGRLSVFPLDENREATAPLAVLEGPALPGLATWITPDPIPNSFSFQFSHGCLRRVPWFRARDGD